jgi:hypothetical protein
LLNLNYINSLKYQQFTITSPQVIYLILSLNVKGSYFN